MKRERRKQIQIIAGSELHWRGWWPQFSQSFCDMMETDDALRECDCECGWVAPYGFVVEAGCPRHD